MTQRNETAPPSHIETRRSIDLRSLLEEAAHLLWESRDKMGAPQTFKRVEDDLRAVVAELDVRAKEAGRV